MSTADVLFLLFGFSAGAGALLVFLAGKYKKVWGSTLALAATFGLAWLAARAVDDSAQQHTRERAAEQSDLAARQEREHQQVAYREQQARERAAKDREEAERTEARKKRLEQLQAMTPAQRMAELNRLCSPEGACDAEPMQLVAFAAATVAERDSLEKQSEALRKARALAEERAAAKADREAAKLEREADMAARANFAKRYERRLFERSMNPQSVTTLGSSKETLHVVLFLCSRQYLYDFANGSDGQEARSVGFKKLTCSDGIMEDGWVDL